MTGSDRPYFQRRLQGVRALLGEQMKQGLSPSGVALAVACGASIGIMPVVWGTSLLCIVAAYCLRLNQIVTLLANFMVLPLHVFLFIPFFLGGEELFSSALLPVSGAQLLAQFSADPGSFAVRFWRANLQALAAWLVVTPLFFPVVFAGARVSAGKIAPAMTGRPRRR